MFMTFHGEPRAGEEAMHHAHESPWVMLIPLIVLAIGAAFFGFLGYDFFVGDERAGFWKSAILVLPQYDSLAAAEGIPALVRYMPLIVALIGIAIAYVFYIADPRLPVRLAAQFRALYLFLLNKWYFDELYDWLFVRTAFVLGDGLWKSRRRRGDRRARAERRRRGHPRSRAAGQPAADRLSLSLRLCDDDRPRRDRHLVPVPAVSA